MAISKLQSFFSPSISALMAILFGYSASVQLNDPDWYFWFPLYATAFGVNVLEIIRFKNGMGALMAKVTLWGGILLFMKVVSEAYFEGSIGLLWSFDMRERAVREKLGSLLVVASMALHVKASSSRVSREYNGVGMAAALVALSYGLSFYFFALVKDDMKL